MCVYEKIKRKNISSFFLKKKILYETKIFGSVWLTEVSSQTCKFCELRKLLLFWHRKNPEKKWMMNKKRTNYGEFVRL